MNCGIYKITNLTNSKIYIGSSRNLSDRRINHFALLRHNKHPNGKLQNSFNKYSEAAFEFKIILVCEEFELERYENYLIDKLQPELNIEKSAKRRAGDYKPTKETIEKMAASKRGKPSPKRGCKLKQEQIDILRAVNVGNQNASTERNIHLITPDGIHINGTIKNMSKFCREYGIVSNGSFLGFINGRKNSYKGRRIIV